MKIISNILLAIVAGLLWEHGYDYFVVSFAYYWLMVLIDKYNNN